MAHKRVSLNSTVVRFPRGAEIYLIFEFLRSENKAKRGVDFHQSMRHALRIWQKVEKGRVLMGTECFNTRFPGFL